MNRERQLLYCKKCKYRELDLQEGMICGISMKKAEFENVCSDFLLDNFVVEEIKKRREENATFRVSFGFPPKQTETIDIFDLNEEQLFQLVKKSVEKLGWKILEIGNSRIVAQTSFSLCSWREEVSFFVEFGSVEIQSVCVGNQFVDWGKNRKNIDDFSNMFFDLKENADLSVTLLEEKQELIDLQDSETAQIEDQKGLSNQNRFWDTIIPSRYFVITPILGIVNVLVFVIMLFNGAHFVLPSIEVLLAWGANFRPLTIEGESWRLFTSMFLHIGIFHLLMNMYALIFIGIILEPLIGKARFISAYIVSGIIGSVASVVWNAFTVSAGASGAIFGMYGVFLALLSTNFSFRNIQKSLLISILVFVLYNLFLGFTKTEVDNAAHIGGLLSGLIVGYSFLPSLKKNNHLYKNIAIAFSFVFCIATSSYFLSITSSDFKKYDKDMSDFSYYENMALSVYFIQENEIEDEELGWAFDNAINYWNVCMMILNKIDEYTLPDLLHERNKRIKRYCSLRIMSYSLVSKSLLERTDRYKDELNRCNLEINKLMVEIKAY